MNSPRNRTNANKVRSFAKKKERKKTVHGLWGGKGLLIVRANKPQKRASYEMGEVGQGDVDYTRCKAGLPFQQLTKNGWTGLLTFLPDQK